MAATRSRISAGLPRMDASASILKTLAVLFALVKDHMQDTRIVVTGEGPAPRVRAREQDSQEMPSRRRRNFEDIFSNWPDTDRARPTWQDMH